MNTMLLQKKWLKQFIACLGFLAFISPAVAQTNLALPITHLTIGYVLGVGTQSYDYDIDHNYFLNATNRLNAILPANFDLEGTWVLDSAPEPDPTPSGSPYPPYTPTPMFTVGYLETEHYGVDTMILKKTGFQAIEPLQGNVADEFGGTNMYYYQVGDGGSGWPQTFVTPGVSATRTLVYYYSGTLTHRFVVGCSDRVTNLNNAPYGGQDVNYYVPRSTSSTEDLTYQLDAALVLSFDVKGKFLWSDLIFNGTATNAPTYPEIPTNIVATENDRGQDFTYQTLNPYAPIPVGAPYLGVFQSLSGDAITINGAGVYTNGHTTMDYVAPVVEFGQECVNPDNGLDEPPVVKAFNFGAVDNAGGTAYWFDGNFIPSPVESTTVFWHRTTGATASLPTGTISGQLKDPVTHLAIKRGAVYLYAQNSVLDAPTNGETPAAYYFYISSNSTYSAVTTVDAQGNFTFSKVPNYQPGGGGVTGLRAVEYAVVVQEAETDGFDTNNPVIYYQNTNVANLTPQTSAAPIQIPLTSLSDFGIKRALASALSMLAPYNYSSDENTVVGDMSTYLQNNATVTPAQEEGVKRAIWGERAIQEGALDAQGLYTPMLKALASAITTILNAALPNTTGRGDQGKALLAAQKKGVLSPADLAQFKIGPNVSADLSSLVADGYNAEGLDLVDKLITGVGSGLKIALGVTGMNETKVDTIGSGFVTVMEAMAKAVRGISGLGSSSKVPPGVDQIVTTLVPMFAPTLFDSTLPFSYTAITQPSVYADRVFMEQWTNYNPSGYSIESQNAAGVVSNMALLVTHANQALAYVDAITASAGTSSKVFTFLGDVTGIKQFTAVGKAADLVEKLGTGTSLAVPEQIIFSYLPDATSNGVYTAFGGPAPPASQSRYKPATRLLARSKADAMPQSILSNTLFQADAQLNNKITLIIQALNSNDIGTVITQLVKAPPTFGDSLKTWDQAAGVVRESAGSSTNAALPNDTLMALAAEEAAFSMRAGAFDYELVEIVKDIVTGVYKTKTDPNYVAAVASAVADGQALSLKLESEYSSFSAVADNFDLSGSLPVVLISLTPPVSQTTGLPWVSVTNEMFVMTSYVANASSVAVTGITLNLDIQGANGVAVCVTPTNQPGAGLSLAANDGVAGSGPDQAAIVWRMRYTGALDTSTAYFVVSAQENGAAPVSFTCDSESQTLQVDSGLVDSDGDGIPDDWMTQYFGHPQGEASDNSLASDPAPNGDGNTILEDYQNGLNPLTTNAVAADAVLPTNVSLALSTNFIELGPNNAIASILVSTGDTNAAYWTASVDDPALVTLEPDSSTQGTNGQVLSLALPPSYDYTNSPRIQTVVRVAPTGLSSGPAQSLTLVIDGLAGVPQTGKTVVVRPPQPAAVGVGSNFVLTVVAGGAGPLKYKWQHNGANIAGATNATLTVTNARPNQAGTYHVVAANSNSIAGASASVVVYTPVSIKTQPVGPAPRVVAAGTGPFHYQWSFNGAPLRGKTGAALALTAAGPVGPGYYQVVVSNRYRLATSAPVLVAGLQLLTNGSGKIIPAFHGSNLFVGAQYTLSEAPGKKSKFSSWEGGTNMPYTTLATTARLKFIMMSNLVIEANFTSNVLEDAQGVYNGLFAPVNEPRSQTNSGSVTLAVTPTGLVTGKLSIGARTVLLAGAFDDSGAAQIHSTPEGLSALDTSLQLDMSNRVVIGTVTDGSFTARLFADLDVFTGTENAAQFSGGYTLPIAGTNRAAVKIDASGRIMLSGLSPDGAPFVQSSVLSKDGLWPFYVSLHNGAGSLWSWNQITNGIVAPVTPVSYINSASGGQSAR